jgi:nitronate monooxygenase/enoyl-[acyl-carrier protein] reductase II
VPVVAAGGIADGRALAAALALRAQGVNVGTRFMASTEAELDDAFKAAILGAASEDTVRAAFVNDLVPPESAGSFASAPRVLRNAFVDEWHGREDEARRERDALVGQLRAAMGAGTAHELLPIMGEVAGAIHEILPAAEIVARMVDDADRILRTLAASGSGV